MATKQLESPGVNDKENRLAILATFKKLSVQYLKILGYDLSKRQTNLGNKPYKFKLIEVLNDDKKGMPDFSFLYSVESKEGIILPHAFDYYSKHPLI